MERYSNLSSKVFSSISSEYDRSLILVELRLLLVRRIATVDPKRLHRILNKSFCALFGLQSFALCLKKSHFVLQTLLFESFSRRTELQIVGNDLGRGLTSPQLVFGEVHSELDELILAFLR